MVATATTAAVRHARTKGLAQLHNSPLYAAIDLGSNSFHMLVVREVAGALRTVTKVKRKVRLAAGLDPEFRLSRAAMERGWDCLRLFSEQLQDIPSDNIRVVGTATLRLATNVDEFLSEAERVLNHSIEIISGEEEAKTIYEGVSWTSAGEGNRLVIDIGGASTELVIGEHSEAKLLNSLHMGCVTWLNNHFGDGELSEARFQQAIAAAKTVLEKVAEDYRALGWRTCVGASGTVQALQEIMLAQGKSERVTLPKLQELMGQAIACGRLDRLQLEGLAAERLTVFPSGLAILIAIFETLNIESMTLAGGALREGLIYGLLGNNHDCDARDRTADSLISRYQLDKEHAERVRDTAVEAFNQLQPAWRLSKRYGRPILRYAALLFNQRDEFKLDTLEKQGAVTGRQAIRLARILRIALILCMRRTQGTVPSFTLQAEEESLTLTLPKGWMDEHYLRASELRLEVERQQKMGWPTRVQEA